MNRRDLIKSAVAISLYGPRFPAGARTPPSTSTKSFIAPQGAISVPFPRTAIVAIGGYGSGDNQSYQAGTPWLSQVPGQQISSSGFFPNAGNAGQLSAVAMMGRYDVVLIGGNYEGWGSTYGARSNLVEAIKEISYPAGAQSVVLQYEIFEAMASSGGAYPSADPVVSSEKWYLYAGANNSGGAVSVGGSTYETNWAVAWPNAVGSVGKDNSFVNNRFQTTEGESEAWSGYSADYFANLNFICQDAVSGEASGSIPASAYLDSRWNFDANEKAPNLDGIYSDNNYASSRWPGYYDLQNNYEAGNYTVGAWLVRGAYWHHWQFTQEIATAYPGRTYYRTCNFASWDQGYAAGEFSTFSSGMANYMHGGLMEGMIGKSYGILDVSGWNEMMNCYRAMMGFVISPRLLMVEVSTNGASDYQYMRFGLSSALMNDGYAMVDPYQTSNQNYWVADYTWYDEFGGNPGTNITKGWLGQPIGTPPTAAAVNNVWIREFENGVVLCNPKGNGAQTVTAAQINSYLGASYTFAYIQGIQDTVTNPGGTFSQATLSDSDGLLLLKGGGGGPLTVTLRGSWDSGYLSSGVTQKSVGRNSAVNAGDILIVCVLGDVNNDVTSVVDGQFGTLSSYSGASNWDPGNFSWVQFFWAVATQNYSASSTNEISANFSSSTGYAEVIAAQFRCSSGYIFESTDSVLGASVNDGPQASPGTSAGAIVSGSTNFRSSPMLAFAGCLDVNGTGGQTAANGWTSSFTGNGANFVPSWSVIMATGSQEASWTASPSGGSDTYQAMLIGLMITTG